MNAHHQDFRGAIRERHQVSAADSSDLNGSSSNVLEFDSKKILNLRAGGEIPSETMRGNLGE